jgi:LEA14-like dessication related protein
MRPKPEGQLKRLLAVGLAAVALLLASCATFRDREPIEVYVADVAAMQGEGMEMRMLVKLRIQNPNDAPLEFNGVMLNMDVQGRPFATGVSDAAGVVPRFREAVVAVPVSLSVMGVARRAVDIAAGAVRSGKLTYELTGRLARPGVGSELFKSDGEFVLPAELFGP